MNYALLHEIKVRLELVIFSKFAINSTDFYFHNYSN